jgi:hypothetical protein
MNKMAPKISCDKDPEGRRSVKNVTQIRRIHLRVFSLLEWGKGGGGGMYKKYV